MAKEQIKKGKGKQKMGTMSTKGKGKSPMRPRLMFAHSNEEGTGSAIQVELHPATLERPGSLMIEFADQTDAGYVDSDGYHNGGFNWSGSLKFRLKLALVGQLARVLRGEAEAIGNGDDDCVDIRRKNDTVEFSCKHTLDTAEGGIELWARVSNEDTYTFRLRREEILILDDAIRSSMGLLAWGEGAAE